MGLELTTLRSRVACSTDWGSQVPLWPMCFDLQAPFSVISGPILRVIFSFEYSFREILFLPMSYQPRTSNGKFRLTSGDPVFLTLSWLKSSQKQRNNGNYDRVILSWACALCQALFHWILLSVWGGDCCNPYFQMRRLNSSLVLKVIIVGTRTQNQTQTTGSCSDLL